MEVLDWVVEQVKTADQKLATMTFGIEDLVLALNNALPNFATPCAFVLYLGEQGGADEAASYVAQKVTTQFAVILAVSNTRTTLNKLAGMTGSDLQVYRRAVASKLIGKTPDQDATFNPCKFLKGRYAQVTDKVLWWQDDYVTEHFVRGP